MSYREPGWTYSDAQTFITLYDAQVYYGELITIGEWYIPGDSVFDLLRTGEFLIGGLNPSGIEDASDIAEIWLETGNSYSFGVSGTYENIYEGLSIEVFDNYGYLLSSSKGVSNPLLEDSILDFRPSYTGWHNLWILAEDSYYIIYADVVIGVDLSIYEDVSDVIVLPYIMNRDDSNWDNDINTGRDTYIAAEDAQLYRAYMGAMGRIPDWGGFNWWAYEIKQGENDLFTMADGFIKSSEFKGSADLNFDNYISNHEFISHMYEGVFGRAPDQGGYEYWMDELNSGESDQAEVLIYMTQSNEYIDQTLEVVADYLFT